MQINVKLQEVKVKIIFVPEKGIILRKVFWKGSFSSFQPSSKSAKVAV